jgi:hypothetical protein
VKVVPSSRSRFSSYNTRFIISAVACGFSEAVNGTSVEGFKTSSPQVLSQLTAIVS